MSPFRTNFAAGMAWMLGAAVASLAAGCFWSIGSAVGAAVAAYFID